MHEPLGESVQIRRSCRQSNDLNAFSDQNAAQCVRVFRIPIENQIALAAQEAVVRVGEIARDLRHPPAVGMGSDTSDLHGAVDDIDEEQNVVCHQRPITGMAPLSATVYACDRLRCNLCGEVYTAAAPEGVGNEKYDATATSMVGLLKYGAGLPFNRIET